MATTLDVASTRVLDFTETNTDRLATVIETIAKTEKIMLMSGPGVSIACGLSYLDMDEQIIVQSGDSQYGSSLQNAFDDCSLLNTEAKSVSEDKLAAFNKYMVDLRIRARSAPMSIFHLLLQRTLREKRVMRCLTTSFDGLDQQPDSAIDEKVIRMYGDNRFLRCCMPLCPGIYSAEEAYIDDQLRSKGIVFCPPCTREAQKIKSQRLAAQSAAMRLLRPAVDIHLPTELQRVGDLRSEVMKEAKSCQLLLIVGLPLKSGEVYDLMRELASEVHHSYGAVVYVDNETIRGRNTSGIIDFHLQMDIEDFSSRILVEMDNHREMGHDINADPALELDQSEIWYEVMNNTLEPESSAQESEDTGPLCCLCGLSDPLCLTRCTKCSDYLCIPSIYGPYGKHKSCLVFGGYTGRRPDPLSTKSDKDDFICPWCWKHSEHGLYPHYVRPAPQMNVHMRDGTAPRMAMIIYYLDQFWPHAKHLCSLVKNRWQMYGWPSHVEPAKLEGLTRGQKLFPQCEWEVGTFDIFVIYLTHGLQNPPGYQLYHNKALAPVEFLKETLVPLHDIIGRSQHTHAIMMCCGHPLYSARHVKETQEWINNDGVVDVLLSFFNRKLAPAFMAGMIARMTTSLAGRETRWIRPIIVNTWLTDGVACGHSDSPTRERATASAEYV
ncbi:Eukaryotic translation initiation factor 3 subunit B [Rhizoctonia solani]|uniref:Eukaryotic translation initiation factor 3 subunit B n=1 Tax=Rhizoctonia solani TaxID=456999 RepID=A0A0K6G9A4_9AGAM|nr:Eukaryotic translation initiation factor 3 subunit B [Rhizoctonia solani]